MPQKTGCRSGFTLIELSVYGIAICFLLQILCFAWHGFVQLRSVHKAYRHITLAVLPHLYTLCKWLAEAEEMHTTADGTILLSYGNDTRTYAVREGSLWYTGQGGRKVRLLENVASLTVTTEDGWCYTVTLRVADGRVFKEVITRVGGA